MKTTREPDTWELADYGRVLRRRWWVVLALACAGLAIAAAYVKLAHKTYTATTSVSVTALPTDPRVQGAGASTVDMDNEAQLVQSNAVATLAGKQLHSSQSPSQLAHEISVTVPPNTTLLQITCQASKPSAASDCANAFASAYLTTRLNDAASTVQGQLTALRAKANALLPEVAHVTSSAHGLTGASPSIIARRLQVRAANAQLNAVVSKMNYVSSELASLQSPDNTLAGHVTSAAHPPSSATSPRKALILPGGLVAGLILGVILAFWLELRDKRLHGPRELERAYDLPTLLDLRGKRTMLGDLAVSGSRQIEAFAELAEYVASTPTQGCFVLLVVGATSEAGTSVVAADLAAALSESRPDVFLVSAAPAATGAPRLLGVESRRGLAQVLAGGAPLEKVARRPREFLDLRVVGPGTVRAATAPRQNYDARRALVDSLRAQARYVIVESPLTSGVPAAFALAEFADAAIMVVEASHTRRSEIDAWSRQLERTRVPVLGAVLVPRLDGAKRLLTRRRAAGKPTTAVAAPAQAAEVSSQQRDTETALLR